MNLPKLAGALEWESLGLLRRIATLRIGYFGTVFIALVAYGIEAWNQAFPAKRIALPVSMFFAFLGSALLTVGHLLNEILCPKVIKVHTSLREYQASVAAHVDHEDAIVGAGKASDRLRLANDMSGRLPANIPDALRDRVAQAADALAQAFSDIAQLPSPNEPLVTNYRQVWEDANQALRGVRYVIGGCYIAAAVIGVGLLLQQVFKFSVVFRALG